VPDEPETPCENFEDLFPFRDVPFVFRGHRFIDGDDGGRRAADLLFLWDQRRGAERVS
jgi:hypothetical protein